MLFTLPLPLKEDLSMSALAEAAGGVLTARLAEIDRLRIIPNIDGLEDALLSILARDFKVDWYAPNYSLEEKRRTVRSSWRVHKILGTKTAVETALRAVYPDTTVKRWFEYGGKPYHFRLHIDMSAMKYDGARPWQVIEKVNYYKSLRDHLDRIEFTIKPKEDAVLRLGGCLSAQTRLPLPELPDCYDLQSVVHVGGIGTAAERAPIPELDDIYDFRRTVHIGGAGATAGESPIPETADIYNFPGTVCVGGAGAAAAKLPLPEDTATQPASGRNRTGGQSAIRFTLPIPELE